MRCFYCGREGRRASKEHIVPANLGGRFVTRKVCCDCNNQAGDAVDRPISDRTDVGVPRASNDVRHSRRSSKPAEALDVPATAADGRRITIRFTPGGKVFLDASGGIISASDVGIAEYAYGLGSDEWVRFGAKVALGSLSHIVGDAWLDTELAKSLQILLRGGSPNPRLWPSGVQVMPFELPASHAIPHALGRGRHLVALNCAEDDPRSTIAGVYLFGGGLCYELSLPGFAIQGSGRAWILDPAPSPPPRDQDFDTAIEDLLREKGYSDRQIGLFRVET